MGSALKFGLGVNADEKLESLVEKSVVAEDLGLDHLWISDLPDQLYAPVVASAVASRTKKIQIGLGLMSVLLHSPRDIAMAVTTLCDSYGQRFDLCIGIGDVRQLDHVGIHVDDIHDLPLRTLEAKRKIVSRFRRDKVKADVWLGAQGPRMLATAKNYDGVLLNYSKPEMLKWAIDQARLRKNHRVKIGIYSPSYVHMKPQPSILALAKAASAVVALGASSTVLRKFGLYEKLRDPRKKAMASATLARILDAIPDKVVEDFSITMRARDLPSYLENLRRLNVSDVVFAYPQNYSVETVRELKEALDLAS